MDRQGAEEEEDEGRRTPRRPPRRRRRRWWCKGWIPTGGGGGGQYGYESELAIAEVGEHQSFNVEHRRIDCRLRSKKKKRKEEQIVICFLVRGANRGEISHRNRPFPHLDIGDHSGDSSVHNNQLILVSLGCLHLVGAKL